MRPPADALACFTTDCPRAVAIGPLPPRARQAAEVWKTVHRRVSRSCHARVWERVFDPLTADQDNQYLMIDSTIVRFHQHAATGKEGRRTRAFSLGRGCLD